MQEIQPVSIANRLLLNLSHVLTAFTRLVGYKNWLLLGWWWWFDWSYAHNSYNHCHLHYLLCSKMHVRLTFWY